jgi:hypothetical protein
LFVFIMVFKIIYIMVSTPTWALFHLYQPLQPIVIKPGLARRVDPGAGPVRVCQKTGRGNDPAGQPVTRVRPRRDLFFFFSNMGFETYQYILYVPTKKVMFFQCEIWNSLVYMLYVHKKKAMFFQCEIWNPLVYMLYIPKKKLSFFNVEFKTH